jgi:hypothetical protein
VPNIKYFAWEYSTYIKTKGVLLDWLYLAWEPPSKTHYERKDRLNWKNMMKMQAAAG